MELVFLALALPLAVLAIVLTFGKPHLPAATAPVRPSRHLGRALAWTVTVYIFLGIYMVLSRNSCLDNLVRLILLSRYGLLTGLLLVGLVPLSLQAAPSLLASLFVLRGARHLFHIAWLTVLVASAAIVVTRVEEINAPVRFQTDPLPILYVWREWARVAVVLILSLPLLLACGRCSREAFLPKEAWRSGPWVVAGLLGLAFGLLLMILVSAVQPMLLSTSVSNEGLYPLQPVGEWLWRQLGSPQTDALYPAGDRLAGILKSPGYTIEGPDGSPRLAHGHAQAIVGFAAVLAVYVGHFLLVKVFGMRALHAADIPPLFLLLVLLMLLGFFLQGAAFALDHDWIPASLAVVFFAFAIYQFSRTDHLFSLGNRTASGGVRAAPQAARIAAPELQAVAKTWHEQRVPSRTLVAVTASGGGIQAAAWTARVLVGLHERYGDPFMRSIRLLSAVSGGSVGAMYALDAWPPDSTAQWRYPNDSPLPADDSVCGRAMANSLQATAWGLVFPDLLRILAPWVVSRTDDRGARIEEAWRVRLRNAEARMTDWISRVRAGEMPIPIFNATIVETGQRFLASPVLLSQEPELPPAVRPRQLFELYPGTAPLVSTMVRLSATFPFVSPICRPAWSPSESWSASDAYHFADGGYVDNEGMITIIEYLMKLLDPIYVVDRPFDRILLVRLMPFPSSFVAPASLERGWFYATFGPIDAIQNVRTASQMERNELAVRLLTETAAARGVEVRAVTMRYDVPGATEPPLSWMLTSPQKAAIDRAWRRLLTDSANPNNPLAAIDAWFPPGEVQRRKNHDQADRLPER
jgi:hypothetical protein